MTNHINLFIFDEAKKMLRQTISKAEALFGTESHIVLGALWELGGLLVAQRDLGAAEKVFRQVNSKFLKMFGCDDPNTLTSSVDLALAISLQHDAEKSAAVLSILQENLVISRRKHGQNHIVTRDLLEGLARTLLALFRFEEARGLAEELRNMELEALGPEHQRTKNAFRLLEECEQRLQLQNDSTPRLDGNDSIATAQEVLMDNPDQGTLGVLQSQQIGIHQGLFELHPNELFAVSPSDMQ